MTDLFPNMYKFITKQNYTKKALVVKTKEHFWNADDGDCAARNLVKTTKTYRWVDTYDQSQKSGTETIEECLAQPEPRSKVSLLAEPENDSQTIVSTIDK